MLKIRIPKLYSAGCLIYAFFIICWIVNLVQFLKCDFEAPYREEIIKLVGIIIAPVSAITVWF